MSDAHPAIIIGRRLAAARIKAKISQAELGKVIGVSGPRISHFESGHATPRPEYHGPLAEAVHVNVNRLFSPVPDAPEQPRRFTVSRPNNKTASNAEQIAKLVRGMDQRTQNVALAILRTLSRMKS